MPSRSDGIVVRIRAVGLVFAVCACSQGRPVDAPLEARRPAAAMAPAVRPSVEIERIAIGGPEIACAVFSDGSLYCWRAERIGKVRDGTRVHWLLPVRVPVQEAVRDVAINHSQLCAVTRRGGHVVCWRSKNDRAESTIRAELWEGAPEIVEGLDGVVSLAVALTHACAVRQDGSVWCWGHPLGGKLGGELMYSADPLPPRRVEGISSARSVSVFNESSCALLQDGTVTCWGKDMWGTLGKAAGLDNTPRDIGIRDVERFELGGHSCAVMRAGSVSCWGFNYEGQASPSTKPDFVRQPTRVPGIEHAVEVVGGGNHTCARLSDGSVRCWGAALCNSTRKELLSADVDLEIRATAIAAGGNTLCAVVDPFRVRCWSNVIPARAACDVTPPEVIEFR